METRARIANILPLTWEKGCAVVPVFRGENQASQKPSAWGKIGSAALYIFQTLQLMLLFATLRGFGK